MIKFFKIAFSSLKSLSVEKIVKLVTLLFLHPWFSILTIYATFKAFQLSQKYFKNNHSNDGVGNAFRHSLWNCMILMYCCKIASPTKANKWTEHFTTFFEELFSNPPLQRAMDLHNNQIGREVFLSLIPTHHRQFVESSFFIDLLLEKTQNPLLLTDPQQTYNPQLWALHL